MNLDSAGWPIAETLQQTFDWRGKEKLAPAPVAKNLDEVMEVEGDNGEMTRVRVWTEDVEGVTLVHVDEIPPPKFDNPNFIGFLVFALVWGGFILFILVKWIRRITEWW